MSAHIELELRVRVKLVMPETSCELQLRKNLKTIAARAFENGMITGDTGAVCDWPEIAVFEIHEAGTWWCHPHHRPATAFRKDGTVCCDPKLGGITMPCQVQFLPLEVTTEPAAKKET